MDVEPRPFLSEYHVVRATALYVLAEGSQRTSGGDARTANVAAGRAVATPVRTTPGPRGTDEMLVDSSGDVVTAVYGEGSVVPGAGATEVAIADRVRSGANAVTGRMALAVEAFADAVDEIPRTLAETAGMDPVDALVDLRSMFDREGTAGIVIDGGRVTVADPAGGVVDPAVVKREALESATEAAAMILRIDDVIAAN